MAGKAVNLVSGTNGTSGNKKIKVEYSDLKEKDRITVVTTYLRTGEKRRTQTLCNITSDCFDKVINEYYLIIRDVLDDQNTVKLLKDNLHTEVQMCTDITNDILKLYSHQVTAASKIISSSPDKLIGSYLMDQLHNIFYDVNQVRELQLKIDQQNKKALFDNTVSRQIRLKADEENAIVDSEAYMLNQSKLADAFEDDNANIMFNNATDGYTMYFKDTSELYNHVERLGLDKYKTRRNLFEYDDRSSDQFHTETTKSGKSITYKVQFIK